MNVGPPSGPNGHAGGIGHMVGSECGIWFGGQTMHWVAGVGGGGHAGGMVQTVGSVHWGV